MIYQRFTEETVDEKGRLTGISFHPPEHFNFAFDVMDELGRTKPDERAMVWLSEAMEERVFTFGDFKRESSRAAHYFANMGIGKGDVVMLVLKRHYQFWFAVLALHKLGRSSSPPPTS